jgi:hypothetical protein
MQNNDLTLEFAEKIYTPAVLMKLKYTVKFSCKLKKMTAVIKSDNGYCWFVCEWQDEGWRL